MLYHPTVMMFVWEDHMKGNRFVLALAAMVAGWMIMAAIAPVFVAAQASDPNQEISPAAPACYYNLGDYVWVDTDADGRQDGGEPGIGNVRVRLFDGSCNPSSDYNSLSPRLSITTNGSGYYQFTGLSAGNYCVVIRRTTFQSGSALYGYIATTKNAAGVPSDLDSNGTYQKTPYEYEYATATITDHDDMTYDFGFYKPAALGDFVWLDANNNGIQDTGEAGIPNVTVNLFTPGADSTCNTIDDGASIKSMTTGSDGKYKFESLTPGAYCVQFVAPSGYNFSQQNQGDDAKDSDANPATGWTDKIMLTSGQTDLTWDAGLYQQAALGDFVWLDANANGIQDAGEAGIQNVTVNLFAPGLDGNCNTGDEGPAVKSMTTGSDGKYKFESLTPGAYCVQFVAPSGYFFSPQNQGSDGAKNSDANSTTGWTDKITLAPGQTDLTWDAGLYQTISLGDYVWNDSDSNGLQDDSLPGFDAGFDGVTVWLFQGQCNPALNYNSQTPFKTTVTAKDVSNSSGWYLFTGLVPGASYCVVIPQSALNSTLLNGLDPTVAPQAANSKKDSNGVLKEEIVDNVVIFKYDYANVPSLTANADTPGIDDTIDFGFIGAGPTAITLSSLSVTGGGAQSQAGLAVIALGFVLTGSAVTFQRRRSR